MKTSARHAFVPAVQTEAAVWRRFPSDSSHRAFVRIYVCYTQTTAHHEPTPPYSL